MEANFFEPVAGIDARPAAMSGASGKCIAVREIVFRHTKHHANIFDNQQPVWV
jgi:hypothetical protein